MPPSQSGILPEPQSSALFLILRARDRVSSARTLARAAAGLPALGRRVAALDPRAKLVTVVGLGPELWDAISPDACPAQLSAFRDVSADGRRAPATGGDLLLHVVSKRSDLNLELARRFRAPLGDAV